VSITGAARTRKPGRSTAGLPTFGVFRRHAPDYLRASHRLDNDCLSPRCPLQTVSRHDGAVRSHHGDEPDPLLPGSRQGIAFHPRRGGMQRLATSIDQGNPETGGRAWRPAFFSGTSHDSADRVGPAHLAAARTRMESRAGGERTGRDIPAPGVFAFAHRDRTVDCNPSSPASPHRDLTTLRRRRPVAVAGWTSRDLHGDARRRVGCRGAG
jgi:hypothetical protein